MRSIVAVLGVIAAGCSSTSVRLVWSGKPVVEFELWERPAPLGGPIDETALSCWRARADVDHGGFFVMSMSRGSYALRFCVRTLDLLAAAKGPEPKRVPVRIDVSGDEDLVHAVQKMTPACAEGRAPPMSLKNVAVPESYVTLVPEKEGIRFDFDATFGVFLDIETALEEESVHLWEERQLVGSFLAKDPPAVTDRGRVRCLP